MRPATLNLDAARASAWRSLRCLIAPSRRVVSCRVVMVSCCRQVIARLDKHRRPRVRCGACHCDFRICKLQLACWLSDSMIAPDDAGPRACCLRSGGPFAVLGLPPAGMSAASRAICPACVQSAENAAANRGRRMCGEAAWRSRLRRGGPEQTQNRVCRICVKQPQDPALFRNRPQEPSGRHQRFIALSVGFPYPHPRDTPPQRGALIWKGSMTNRTIPARRPATRPAVAPANPRFSSGPCAKPPTFALDRLADAPLGRSHRARVGKDKLKAAIETTRDILGVPADYRIGIVPASDTGAYEIAMWTMLGQRPVEMVAWESFGAGWVTDAVKQLKLDARVHEAAYGEIVDMAALDYDRDVCFTWNGTTSGVRVASGDAIPADRGGLTLCDATSAAFAQDLPWDRLDVATFSWQKVLGGEAAHGVLILSPRAVERLESYTPEWPLPKIFRLTKGGKLNEGIFVGETINTPSMMAVEDYLLALDWARSVGGMDGLRERAYANLAAVQAFVADHDWLAFLAADPAVRSNTSVCLKFTDDRISDGAAFAKAVVNRLDAEGVAHDISAYRDAPPGLRIWCGGTVETTDVAALMPWIEWAYQAEIAAFSETA